MIWAKILLTIFQLYLTFLVGYLLLLTAASWAYFRFRLSAHSRPLLPTNSCLRFLILIPAHNEEHLLPDLLESLSLQNYPAELYEVHVVADNCSDGTAAVARQRNAYVHVRSEPEHCGKGYALNWLLDRLSQADESPDAVVFLDADSIVSANFLQVMATHLERGETAIQAYYAVRDPGRSWASSLRYAALAVLHYLRPIGRAALGASVGLKGNGMVFSWDLMERYSWTSSLTEDIELHMTLLLMGEQVTFAPEAIVWGEMPDKLSNSTSQHMRWEQGRQQMARTYVPTLLKAVWQEVRSGHLKRAFLLFDAAVENIQPPFSILAGATLMSLAAGLALYLLDLATSPSSSIGSPGYLTALNVLLPAGLLLGQGVYLFSGLRMVSAPRQVYFSLLNAPRLMVWKSWQMMQLWLGQRQNSWIRTSRNER